MTEPTFDQLVNFATVRCFGPGAPRDVTRLMFEASPALVEMWRDHHAAFQREIDDVAARVCQWCEGAGTVTLHDGSDADCLRCFGTGQASA